MTGSPVTKGPVPKLGSARNKQACRSGTDVIRTIVQDCSLGSF
jgi:hypothetical protein